MFENLTERLGKTLSLISGFVFLENMFAQGQAHKTILSILAWLVFSIELFGHFKFGWRGKPIIFATIAGSAQNYFFDKTAAKIGQT